MSFFKKSPIVLRVTFILFVLAVLVGLFAFWQGCVVAAFALVLYTILNHIIHQRNAALSNGSN